MTTELAEAQSLLNDSESLNETALPIEKRAVSLASLMLEASEKVQTNDEKNIASQLSSMMDDPIGLPFTTKLSDQCFRSSSNKRVANQLNYLIHSSGIPKFLTWEKKLGLKIFKYFGKILPSILVPITHSLLKKEMKRVILPGETRPLIKHILKRTSENVRVNLNHLGEAILGENEAKNRLKIYLEDLQKNEIHYISIKISTIYSQLNLLAWEQTKSILRERLGLLYQVALDHPYNSKDGTTKTKFVNLDMEEYRDLHLTVEVFKEVLEEERFFTLSAGIVLQAYIPDSFPIQKDLTQWALDRVNRGGAPIKIRIVKGANLAMEKVEASSEGWEQAPYKTKHEVDANFKRMLEFGMQENHAKAAHLGIASHNLFDIAYSLILRTENRVESFVCLEMLEGMADHTRKIVQKISNDMLLYCPCAKSNEFQNAIAYLIRRLDENTSPENFLRHSFEMTPNSKVWEDQKNRFLEAYRDKDKISFVPRKTQNRMNEQTAPKESAPFINEPDTDWAIPSNRIWGQRIISEYSDKQFGKIPLILDGKKILTKEEGIGFDPSIPTKSPYTYSLAQPEHFEQLLSSAEIAYHQWSETSLEHRSSILYKAANLLRKNRGSLLGAMLVDGGKLLTESDPEISEAIDFIEYYRRSAKEWLGSKEWGAKGKGVSLVIPPWNFPLAIPLGGVVSNLIVGNSVILKPSKDSVLIAYKFAEILWEAGIPKNVLQFITCQNNPFGNNLVKDARIKNVILTGGTSTAKKFVDLRPDIDLNAETGGKNATIITDLCDRDNVISDLIHSAFSHSGQKCSATSLAILESPVYNDEHFLEQLKDAAKSLRVGSSWDLETRISPLLQKPSGDLLRGLTTLDDGESWLLKPKQDTLNPRLWSPGIKIGVKPGSYSHLTEFFGPVLSLIEASNLNHAISIANETKYGLTSGLQTLDEREKDIWRSKIEAGNLYINKGTTGAVVQRQPFGGCKESSFGAGAKAGGPNYLSQLINFTRKALVRHKVSLPNQLENFKIFLKTVLEPYDFECWEAATTSCFHLQKNYFSKKHDPSLILGEDNKFYYKPHEELFITIQEKDALVDIAITLSALFVSNAQARICITTPLNDNQSSILKFWKSFDVKFENMSFQECVEDCSKSKNKKLRVLSPLTQDELQVATECYLNILSRPIVFYGRIELLNYYQEVSLSHSYHRYGNLGERENEIRTPIL